MAAASQPHQNSEQSNTMASPSQRPEPTRPTRPAILGIHHLKLAVSNPAISIAWYERVLGARHVTSLDHVDARGVRFSAVCQMSAWGGLLIELRQNPAQAAKDYGWDPVTMSIAGRRELGQWIAWLDHCGTAHSTTLVGTRGWILVFQVSGVLVVHLKGEVLTLGFSRIRMDVGSGCTLARNMEGGFLPRPTARGWTGRNHSSAHI